MSESHRRPRSACDGIELSLWHWAGRWYQTSAWDKPGIAAPKLSIRLVSLAPVAWAAEHLKVARII